jgi:hypothetical protein
VILAGSATLASPGAVLAANGYADTGTTTYVINTAKSEIDVTVTEAIKNTTPSKTVYVTCTWWGATCPEKENYYYYATYIWVPAQAVSVKASSDAGKVSQKVYKTDAYGRELELDYPAVYYGQTRTVKLTYVLPGAPRASGDYRALKAYAEMCGSGTGLDSGTVTFVVPDGFDVTFSGATAINLSGDAKGMQTYSTGKIASADEFWTCMEATRPDVLTNTSVAAGDQAFNLQAWPEDSKWATTVATEIQSDVPALETLTGLKMPGGTIAVQEAGNWQLGEYAGTYSATTKTASITEGTDPSTVAHELSHIWFNRELLDDPWMYEGLAGYSEKAAGAGNYKPCTDPGAYPGTGTPALGTWKYLDNNSTTTDEKVATWQYAASCYLITQVADAIGPDNFKAVLAAASKDEIAYLGTGPAEVSVDGGSSISSRALLDLIDERGMLPAGVTDLDQTQTLFGKYGLYTADLLTARSQARSDYHTLLATTGTWGLPMAVRSAMASWDFAGAQTAMATVTQILTVRDQISKNLPGFKVDGSGLQTAYESAATQKDLDAVLVLANQEAAAASKVNQADQANSASRNVLQSIGLIGVDVSGPLAQANTDLKNAKPADATTSAQKVMDSINSSSSQGLLRIVLILLLILVLLGIALLVRMLRRRRRARKALAAEAALTLAAPLDPALLDAGSPTDAPLDAGVVPPSAATDAVAPAAEAPAPPAPSGQPE